MQVKVLGSNCSKCKTLFKKLEELITDSEDISLEYIDDLEVVMSYNIMGVPALVVDEKVLSVGKVPSDDELKAFLGLKD